MKTIEANDLWAFLVSNAQELIESRLPGSASATARDVEAGRLDEHEAAEQVGATLGGEHGGHRSVGVADDVAALMAQAQRPLHAVMLERLGPTVWHGSPASAMALLEELEETARLWLLSDRRATPLTESQIAELQARFNTLW